MNRLQKLLILLIAGLILQNCSNSGCEYEFQIINETEASLDLVEFSFDGEEREFTIDPQGRTEMFKLSCNSAELFAACAANIGIREYSYRGRVTENLCGREVPRTNFDGGQVIFKITFADSTGINCPRDTFLYNRE